MVSAICVAGTYEGNNKFKLTVCVTVVLKVLAQVEILIPSYGFCPIPPCEEFAENVCDESLTCCSPYFNSPPFLPFYHPQINTAPLLASPLALQSSCFYARAAGRTYKKAPFGDPLPTLWAFRQNR